MLSVLFLEQGLQVGDLVNDTFAPGLAIRQLEHGVKLDLLVVVLY